MTGRRLLRRRKKSGRRLRNATVVQQSTTATGDLTADGYTWAQGKPGVVDQYGKILVWAQRLNAGTKVHVPVVSNDGGATWSEPTRTSFHIAAGEDLMNRGACDYDPTHDLYHVCWVLAQTSGAVIYRAYSVTRDASHNITGLTQARSLQMEIGVAGMAYESPVALYCADINKLLIGWTAVNAAAVTTKAEVRLTMAPIVNGVADATITTWTPPFAQAGAGDADTLGSSFPAGGMKYSCIAKSANARQPWVSITRKPAGATTLAKGLAWFYVIGGTPGTLYYNRVAFGTTDWSGGLGAAVANDSGMTGIGSLQRGGTDAGYADKEQLLSQVAYDSVANKCWVAIPTWKDNTAGDTIALVSVDGNGSASAWVDVYAAGAANTDVGKDIFTTCDVMFDATSGYVVVAYTDLMRHDVYLATYSNGLAVQTGFLAYSATPCDIPTLSGARVNGKIVLLFRDFNVGARTNPPTYSGGPYTGYAVTVDLS